MLMYNRIVIMRETCYACAKKIGLLDIITCKCRCGNLYCCKHRLDHICSYDYSQNYQIPDKLEEKKLNKI
jgi:hypothetical protein